MDLAAWVGRSQDHHDTIRVEPVHFLAATLDHAGPPPAAGDAMPPLRHWLHFLEPAPWSKISADGHPQRGGFLPPVTLPLRMWASGSLTFQRQPSIGEAATLTSTIADVSEKQGRAGALVFVTVRHALSTAAGPCLSEEQSIVYRDRDPNQPSAPAPGKPPAEAAEFSREIVPDPVLLFRFSALTFNAHRIHYDIDFARQEEGYPGLVVHGPLLATLLVDFAAEHMPERPLTGYRFRAVRPTFHTHPFRLEGRRDGDAVKLWTVDHEGMVTMQAEATFGI